MPLPLLAEFVLLAAIWGGSFLFMRLCSADFGPAPLAAVRAGGAALLLMPLLFGREARRALRRHWQAIAVLGVVNSALPFLCFATAALSVTAGLASIFNATTPIWGALIAWLWLGARLDRTRIVGVVIAFAGVLGLVGEKASPTATAHGIGPALATLLCLLATALYGLGAVFTKRYLADAPPLVLAAGSQAAAALVLLAPAIGTWPAIAPGPSAWAAALALALICTGGAYVLYFRLIARLGPAATTNVTFLIPVFGVLWGTVFLNEPFGPTLAVGCTVILAGTCLATGCLATGPVNVDRPRSRSRRPPAR